MTNAEHSGDLALVTKVLYDCGFMHFSTFIFGTLVTNSNRSSILDQVKMEL